MTLSYKILLLLRDLLNESKNLVHTWMRSESSRTTLMSPPPHWTLSDWKDWMIRATDMQSWSWHSPMSVLSSLFQPSIDFSYQEKQWKDIRSLTLSGKDSPPDSLRNLYQLPGQKIALVQDIMTGMFDLYAVPNPETLQRECKELNHSQYDESNEAPSTSRPSLSVGHPEQFYNCLIRNLIQNYKQQQAYGPNVDLYVIVFDKASFMSLMKKAAQTQRTQSTESELYDHDSRWTDAGLVYTTLQERNQGRVVTTPRPFDIRTFIKSRFLRGPVVEGANARRRAQQN